MTSNNLLILLPGMLILLVAVVSLWLVIRRFHRKLGLQKEEREKPTDTSFIINAFRDVTKQLKDKELELERLRALAEQRAENIESYNENILHCVTSGVMTFDIQCTLTTINRAAEEILGMDHDQVVGRTCRELFSESPITQAVHTTLEQKLPSARMEAKLDRAGKQVWLGYNTALLADHHNAAIGTILSFTDLTEVKRLQEQVELRERLTALGEMSAGIAHELRNPMAVISGYLNLLTKKADPAALVLIGKISTEIHGMNRIIGDLLTFARPASLNRVKVNIKEMLKGCLAAVLQTRAEDRRIETKLELDNVVANVDEVLMRQAFSNLLQNALEAMPDGGTVSIEARKAGEVTVVIRDTGAGIPRELMTKIYLPFFTTKDNGTGLGLALVHKIVLSHGGRIDVDSREGKGTAFTVVLPAEP